MHTYSGSPLSMTDLLKIHKSFPLFSDEAEAATGASKVQGTETTTNAAIRRETHHHKHFERAPVQNGGLWNWRRPRLSDEALDVRVEYNTPSDNESDADKR